MSALTPGLYRATVRGVPDVTAMVIDNPDRINGYAYTLTPHDESHYGVHVNEITDAHPLIVLDLGDSDAQQAIWQLRAIQGGADTRRVMTSLADQIEAQTKPPKLAEPKDLGATFFGSQVGECDGSDRTWVRFNSHRTDAWIDALGHIRDWSDLEGVS